MNRSLSICRNRAPRSIGWLAGLALAACGSGHTSAPATPATPATPAATPTLPALEAALLDADAWRAEVHITATGAIAAALDATVLVARGGRIRIDAHGELFGKPVELRWISDGARTSPGTPVPPEVGPAVTIGLVRMGLLHNLARLVSASDPDHADGGVREWVVAENVHALDGNRLGYQLRVDGKAGADVEIGVDPSGRALTDRRIVVHFDQGDMTVEERYHFEFAPVLPADAFTLK